MEIIDNYTGEYSASEIGLEILSVNHYMYNAQSKKVIEKCGFHYDGTARMVIKIKGSYLDNVYYSMTKEEYDTQHN